MIQSRARISAIGSYVPEKKLTNEALQSMVDTTDEWITKRTGIKTRHISAETEYTSDIAVKAVENLVEENDVNVKDVDFIIVATFTPDFYTPSCAALVQGRMGLEKTTGVLDINAACAGFVHALSLANAYITSGMAKKIIVIGAEVLSKIIDYTDRNTAILFGDGASAFLIEESEEGAFLSAHHGSDGGNGAKLFCTGIAKSIENVPLHKEGYLWQDGRAVYNFAIKTVPRGVRALMENAGITIDDVDWFIPHSANMRMIRFICKELNLPMEKTLNSAEDFGNTSAASIPLAVWLGQERGLLKKGDLLVLYGFGGGLNHAGLLVRW